jgi:hypothetical protein
MFREVIEIILIPNEGLIAHVSLLKRLREWEYFLMV